ncbi:MAG: hypothetical protein FJ272_20105 [Planctomycetes bacterium]|nr:hypothetical protein [Planctomycetota bacterium]
MKRNVPRLLRRLGKLRASAGLKTNVLSSVISAQTRHVKALERRWEELGRFVPSPCGRQAPALEPMGFGGLPAHARPIVETHFEFVETPETGFLEETRFL